MSIIRFYCYDDDLCVGEALFYPKHVVLNWKPDKELSPHALRYKYRYTDYFINQLCTMPRELLENKSTIMIRYHHLILKKE